MQLEQIRPLGDNILVKQLSKEKITSCGIIVPCESSVNRYEHVEALKCGPDSVTLPGSHCIILGRGIYEDIMIDGVTYFIIKDADVVATVSER